MKNSDAATINKITDTTGMKPVYQRMEEVTEEINARVEDLTFVQFILNVEKNDWSNISRTMSVKVERKGFSSELKEAEALLETTVQTVKNYKARLELLNNAIDELVERGRKVASIIASMDIMNNIDEATQEGFLVAGFTSPDEDQIEKELLEIRSLLDNTKDLLELRAS